MAHPFTGLVRKIPSLEVGGTKEICLSCALWGGGIFTENLHYSPPHAWLRKPCAEKSAYSGPQPDLVRHKFSVEACAQDPLTKWKLTKWKLTIQNYETCGTTMKESLQKKLRTELDSTDTDYNITAFKMHREIKEGIKNMSERLLLVKIEKTPPL